MTRTRSRESATPPTISTLDVDIHGIAAGGDGVGRADGMVVFVPRTAPGDRARVRATRSGRFARGVLEELLVASPVRVVPACPHFTVDRCGGCQLQHLAYDAQRQAKAGIIRDSLTRIGKRAVPMPEVRPSASAWRYRGKLTLAMRRGASGRWVMGLHPYDDPVGIFPLEDCPITDERVVSTWQEIMRASADLPDEHALRGSVRRVSSGMAVVIEGGRIWPTSERFFAAVPSAAALWWEPAGGERRLLHERAAAPAGASFAQVNAPVAADLAAYVLDRVQAHAPSTAVDAYAGAGDLSVALAERGVRVNAIELDQDAAARCAARLPRGSRIFAARVEEALARVLPADVVILNPPRTGVHERVTALLANQKRAPRAIVYVSCDPATLARDVARLPRFRVASLLAFDMFPQTAHVETVCELVPEAMPEAV